MARPTTGTEAVFEPCALLSRARSLMTTSMTSMLGTLTTAPVAKPINVSITPLTAVPVDALPTPMFVPMTVPLAAPVLVHVVLTMSVRLATLIDAPMAVLLTVTRVVHLAEDSPSQSIVSFLVETTKRCTLNPMIDMVNCLVVSAANLSAVATDVYSSCIKSGELASPFFTNGILFCGELQAEITTNSLLMWLKSPPFSGIPVIVHIVVDLFVKLEKLADDLLQQ